MSEITCEDGCQPSTLRITRTYNSSEVIANRKERTIYSAGVGNRSFTSQADYISFKKDVLHPEDHSIPIIHQIMEILDLKYQYQLI